jgi:hypothetical protein
MADLTGEQIRSILSELDEQVTKCCLTVIACQGLLVKKGYLTESEIAEGIAQLTAEAKDAVAKIHAATHREPPKGVQ